jgi:PadR family transcriptional regulator, regulatory protein PadR
MPAQRGVVFFIYLLTDNIIRRIVLSGDDMNEQMKRGILDGLVLATLHKGDTYGYELTEIVSRQLDIAEMTLYPILRRLEAQGYLETYSQEYSGRLRKYYRITHAGVAKLAAVSAELEELRQIITGILGGDKHEQS